MKDVTNDWNQGKKTRFRMRLLRLAAVYLLLCGFLWAYLTVQTRSYNRMAQEPVAMAQLILSSEDTVSLKLATQTYQWDLPRRDSCRLWIAALPDTAGNSAVFLWQLLNTWFA